ncbi:leucyl aminopeptidase [Candidatus Poribacteria bacterium]|nr:leucyl aminopeptidase [Candidatus Poribacteria bacterium]
MKISVQIGDLRTIEVDAICCPTFEGKELDDISKIIDRSTNGQISRLLTLGDHTGKIKQSTILYNSEGITSSRVCLVGLGKLKQLNLESIRQATASALRKIQELGCKTVACFVPEASADQVQALIIGAKLGLYQFNQYQTNTDTETSIEELCLLVNNESERERVEKTVRKAEAIADGTLFARDLTNQPANRLTPTDLANEAQNLAATNDCLECQIFDQVELAKKGFNALLGVAQGGPQEPNLIQLTYKPESPSKTETVVLVGKGITFDSGGLSLKSGTGMMTMKSDMAGAAAVMATLQVISQIRPNLTVIGLIAATENMPSGTAQKPGDVVKSFGGKTIEILNTDAEGRLVLADVLGYAKNFEPKAVVDLATLTGAVVTALGHYAAGIMGTNQQLIDQLIVAGEATHERLWQLPLFDDYDDSIKSDIADVKNIGDGTAGAIIGGAFLKHFVDGYAWAHIDIGGASDYQKGSAYLPKSASGYGVRLLTRFLCDFTTD